MRVFGRVAGAAVLAFVVTVAVLVVRDQPDDHTILGALRVVHVDDQVSGRSRERVTFVTAAETFKVDLRGGARDATSGPARVTAREVDGRLAVSEVRPLPGLRFAPPIVTTRRVAVFLFDFTNNRAQPWTAEQVRAGFFDGPGSVAGYWSAVSDQKLAVVGDVVGWLHLTQSNVGCPLSSWAAEARALGGLDLSSYQSVVYAWNPGASCGFVGSATLAAPGSTVQGEIYLNGSANSLSTVAHELGHNLGLEHASSRSCSSGGVPVTLGGACTDVEYGDGYSVMGSGGLRYANTIERFDLGWLTDRLVVGQSSTVTVAPANGPAGVNPRVVEVPRPGGDVSIEFRTPNALEATTPPDTPNYHGVTLTLRGDHPGDRTHLLDATPLTPTFYDAPLAPGQTFTAPDGLTIRTVSVSAAGAVVSVTMATSTTTMVTTTTSTTVPPSTTSTTFPPGSAARVGTVGTATRSMAGNTTLSVPVNAPVGVGHRVIVTATVGTFSGTVGCRDSRGNVYAVDARTPSRNLFVCSAPVTAGLVAGDQVTVTYPGFSGQSVAIVEDWVGLGPAVGLGAGSSTSTKTVSVAPFSVTVPRVVLLGAVGGKPLVPGVGWTLDVAHPAGLSTEHRVAAGPGPFSQLGTVPLGGAWRALAVAYVAP